MSDVQIDPKKATKEDIEAGLKLLQQKRVYEEKVKKGEVKGPKKWSDLDEATKKKYKDRDQRYAQRNKLFMAEVLRLLEKNNIPKPVITDAMIDAALATKTK